VGIVTTGADKPYIRIARGRPILGLDPETKAPISQGQKLNIKTRERWEALKVTVDAMFDTLETE